MRVFVAGATGVVGQYLIPGLVAAGHEVTGTTRSPAKAGQLKGAGATPVIVDGLDRRAVLDAVQAVRPDVIVHQMTSLASMRSFRNFDKKFAVTTQLRSTGTDYLLEAARQAGTRRFIAQSFVGWTNARTGSPVKTEADPLDPDPVPSTRKTMAGIRHLEHAVPGAVPEGLVLRYGYFYGHGASDSMLDVVRKRQMPVIGGGAGIWSFCEVTDAATATVAAITRGAPGLYNVVDDDPAPVREWLPYLAECLGVKPPMRAPAWLGKLLAGDLVVALMTEARGASNAKARRELDWTPGYPSWRDGFPDWAKSAERTRAA
ncbi:MAG TPA: NAD(P)-dependent oxidoreductase [Streptosporangiaceae bacterium]|nr:NAD(P)-dependent oxidoreductase [Streptosporangiaceae bacterium]